ncbi:hypothetical protein TorRG33x02_194480, partial [Trema orientale]
TKNLHVQSIGQDKEVGCGKKEIRIIHALTQVAWPVSIRSLVTHSTRSATSFFFSPLHLVVDFSKWRSDIRNCFKFLRCNRAIHILSQRAWVFILRIRVHS